MSSYSAEEHLHFYLNAGTSTEHLLKARLADVNPILIADPRHFESMLILARLPLDSLPPPTVKTITLTESITRCQALLPALAAAAQRIKRVISYRNGVAHAGLVDPSNVPDDLTAFMVVVDLILSDLGYARERFYSEYLDVADARLDESKARKEIEVKAAIATARIEFQRRFSHTLPGYNLEEALHAMEWEYRYEARPHECPACRCRAILSGASYPEWMNETDENGEITSTKLTVHFLPDGLECRVCGLSLRGGLHFADIPAEIILDDVDPDDFIEVDED
ncbi:hypothetical protein [Spirillospora sp. CA-294931]|uniref:hypothetical protein n=1 Tax=Spirillospora sp. CA-294931 TaxID=3240042 RepID=UPI003D8A4A43